MMSKRFKQQDYFRHKKLGISWRKPKGRQSKLRVKKGGSGILPRIGYGTKRRHGVSVLRSLREVEAANAENALIASGIGANKALKIAEKAKQKGIKILNMQKVRRAEKIAASKTTQATKEKLKESEMNVRK
jgi:large subunit ribosomal protein L32e